jgi:hypothetical protein
MLNGLCRAGASTDLVADTQVELAPDQDYFIGEQNRYARSA